MSEPRVIRPHIYKEDGVWKCRSRRSPNGYAYGRLRGVVYVSTTPCGAYRWWLSHRTTAVKARIMVKFAAKIRACKTQERQVAP